MKRSTPLRRTKIPTWGRQHRFSPERHRCYRATDERRPLQTGGQKYVCEAFTGKRCWCPIRSGKRKAPCPSTGKQTVLYRDCFQLSNLTLQSNIYFINSAGELQQKSLTSQVDRRVPHFEARMERGWLYVDWKDPQTRPKVVQWEGSFQYVAVQFPSRSPALSGAHPPRSECIYRPVGRRIPVHQYG